MKRYKEMMTNCSPQPEVMTYPQGLLQPDRVYGRQRNTDKGLKGCLDLKSMDLKNKLANEGDLKTTTTNRNKHNGIAQTKHTRVTHEIRSTLTNTTHNNARQN